MPEIIHRGKLFDIKFWLCPRIVNLYKCQCQRYLATLCCKTIPFVELYICLVHITNLCYKIVKSWLFDVKSFTFHPKMVSKGLLSALISPFFSSFSCQYWIKSGPIGNLRRYFMDCLLRLPKINSYLFLLKF